MEEALCHQWNIFSMEKAWFYERLLFEVLSSRQKIKKYSIKNTMSIKMSFLHYMKRTRVMLPVVFKEFEVRYIFFTTFSFHYHCQLVKGQL